MDNNTLTHHGTKGMRWGVRRFQNKDGSLTPAGMKRYSDVKSGPYEQNRKLNERLRNNKISSGKSSTIGNGIRTISKITKPNVMSSTEKKVSEMSDEELRRRINRIQMEQQYSKLNQKQVSAGKKFVTAILVSAATSVATSYTNKYLGKGVEYLGGKVSKGASKGLDNIAKNIPMNIRLDNLTN